MPDAAALTPAPPAGLTTAQARAAARKHGPNEFRVPARRHWLRELGQRLRNPLIAVLFAASLIAAFTGDVASCLVIVTMILLGIAIDLVQWHRASRAVEALSRRVRIHATVVRDGVTRSVPVVHVVPGDLVLLSAGSVIPGDGILLEANGLHVNEALLTGEPFPVEKRPAAGSVEPDVFMGTSAVSGTGKLRIERIGRDTRIGRIAATLSSEPPPTDFELGMRRFGMLIMRLTAFMVLFVLLVNVAFHRPLLESFLFALALAVGLTPELLPMILSVCLARGALRMADAHVIVKRLPAIESLGSMDVLCTDKTGTLTQARIRLERSIGPDGAAAPRVLELAFLNSTFQAGLRGPLDEAILATRALDASGWRKLDELPFDFERRRVAVLLEDGERRLVVAKGAPEDLLALATGYVRADGTVAPWDEAARKRARDVLDGLGAEGMRALGVAFREAKGERIAQAAESELVFAGFAAFVDPPKHGASAALAQLAASGIAVKVLTGDGEAVTRHLCGRLGLPVEGVLLGSDIERMDDPALAARVESTTLFCRVTPAQKNRIVLMLRARGRVVGFLGDGINDAPALHSADVGISVNNAVDVAREAADLILLRRDLGVLHAGVMEGRRTFVNIRKYILMGASSNFGNMFSMAGATLVLPFLPMLPTQILANNLLYDVSEIPIPLDAADEAEIARPQRWDMALIRRFMWTLGPVSSLFDFLTFYVLAAVLAADEALFHTGWFVESLATQVLVIFVIRTRASPFSSRPAPALVATSLAVVAAAIALPFTPVAPALGLVPPPPAFFAALGALTLAYLGIAQAAKAVFYRRYGAVSRP